MSPHPPWSSAVDELHVCFGQSRLPLSTDALVVVQEVAATEKDDPIAVDLDALWMVRGMAVHHVHHRGIDQPMREGTLGFRNAITPVAAPVNRGHDHVAGTPDGADSSRNLVRGLR